MTTASEPQPGALVRVVASIGPPDEGAVRAARARQDLLTKPRGSLGVLEDISVQLAGLSGLCPPPVPERVAFGVFVGDHGVHAQGVSPWPQEVTAQMFANIVGGGAVVAVLARGLGARLRVVDVGVAGDLGAVIAAAPDVAVSRRVRAGTGDFTAGPAMTREEAERAVLVGVETAWELVDDGADLLCTGDMGIANTTPSAALVAAFTGARVADVTGRGTGVDDATLALKVAVVEAGLARHRPDPGDPLGVLAAVGGLEHAALAGFILGGAARRVPVVLDGVIAVSAALAAAAFAPYSVGSMIAGHRSVEPGALVALAQLGLRPLVDLDLRLGEGSGAALAVPVVQAAARLLRDVATFDSAGVTDKGPTG